ELAAAGVMPHLAGLYEVVVADIESAPDLLELPGHVVAVGLGVLFQLGGALGDLDRVLVVAHEEVDAQPLHAAIAGPHVGADLLERRADVGPTVGVVNRRGQIEARDFSHGSLWDRVRETAERASLTLVCHYTSPLPGVSEARWGFRARGASGQCWS